LSGRGNEKKRKTSGSEGEVIEEPTEATEPPEATTSYNNTPLNTNTPINDTLLINNSPSTNIPPLHTNTPPLNTISCNSFPSYTTPTSPESTPTKTETQSPKAFETRTTIAPTNTGKILVEHIKTVKAKVKDLQVPPPFSLLTLAQSSL
jgi:hypothetical protein